MSNKSGASSQIISLPKGGGALHGIGEKFSPDLYTGTGNFTIPIALPSGRNGFQPQLNLVYSTGNGNGPFGLGWSLNIPGVGRKTSHGIPCYDDAKDVFILSGAEDLVPVEQLTGVTRYRPRTEGLFARIEHYKDASDNYWKVSSKDGLVSYYGKGVPDNGDLPVVADPLKRDNIFAWKLTETCDPFGNRILYEYERDSGEDGPHKWDQIYLKRIRYADYTDKSEAKKFLVSVTFIYDEKQLPDAATPPERPDPFSEYRAGFEIRTRRRCNRILIQTHPDETTLPVRAYEFHYEQDPLNNVSMLRHVDVLGFDDAGQEAKELPPLEFGYTTFEPEKRKFIAVQGADLPAQGLASQDYELVDLFGNGLPDILEMNGTVRYWRNLGGGSFDMPRAMRDAPAGLALKDVGVQMIDANGDGRTDLLVTTATMAGYYPLQYGGLWDSKSFQRYQYAPSFNLEDPEVRLIDLDGDGVTDAIRSGTRMECFFNDPHEGWNGTRFVERKALSDFPNVNFSDPRVKWADMSGDGMQDIVLVHDGNVEYWPNLGYGNWGKRIHMQNSPRFPYGYDPKRILVGDVDGDGLADIVYVDNGKVTLWLNQSGNGWSDRIDISGTPSVSDMDSVRLTDLFGSGVGGVLWSMDANGFSRRNMYFLDFTGGIKPYLLSEMNNHMGAVTRVEYKSSTWFYLEDQKRPATRWKTPLPFPVQVVSRVQVIDDISKGKLTTEYRYHHGYWDGAEREFRGFGMVEQSDTETFAEYNKSGLHGENATFDKIETHFSPPTFSKSWFHQGPIGEAFGDWQEQDWSDQYWKDDPQLLKHTESVNAFLQGFTDRRVKRDALRTLRGSILRSELYALDGTAHQDRSYTITEHAYGFKEIEPPPADDTERLRIFFPYKIADRTTQWERGYDPMTQFSFTDDYDEFGRPRRQTQIACPRGWRKMDDASNAFLATRTRTEYAIPLDADRNYIHDRVSKTTAYEITNKTSAGAGTNDASRTISEIRLLADDHPALQVIGNSVNFYDGGEFTGRVDGKIDKYGALVRTESLVLTEEIIQKAYGTDRPPYLSPSGAGWTSDYPQEFRDELPQLAGYVCRDSSIDPKYITGYYVVSGRRKYDFHENATAVGRGLVTINRDPLNHETTISYDSYQLLPVSVKDPVGLEMTADYDYRVMQPKLVTDPNGNESAFRFTPLGLLKETWVKGKPGKTEGDRQRPSVRMEYDFLAYENSSEGNRQPIFVRAIRQVHHDTESDVPEPERSETIETREYSDGFGRLLQTRTQGEEVRFGHAVFGGGDQVLSTNQNAASNDPVKGFINTDSMSPNVVVSGWQVYDNKGRVVEKYEPFFDTGWSFQPEEDAKQGVSAQMFYDPRGQVIRTVKPDGSEQRVVHGVPGTIAAPALSNPEVYEPTPWEAYTYDANDNAGRTHGAAASSYQLHWNTPASILVDSLGRTIQAVQRNGADPNTDWYKTRSTYDIRGNILEIRDALNRLAFQHVYDFANKPLRIESVDAGTKRTVLDAVGNPVEGRDSKGALILHAYDNLNRPSRLWARDNASSPVTLRSRLEYGDAGIPDQPVSKRDASRAKNLLGKLSRQYDEAGLITIEEYDFKGNPLQKSRQVFSDNAILSGTCLPINWSDPIPDLLDQTIYTTLITHDGLNRIKRMLYPKDVEGNQKELRPHYNRAGGLERVTLDNAPYVDRIAYNAKGQRTLIAYGNSVMTRYAYDPNTFRLVRMRTERYVVPLPAELTYQPTGELLQNFAYTYDLAGNILNIKDRTPGCGVINSSLGTEALDRAFTYDPLYRLITATGRESNNIPNPRPWTDDPRQGFNSNQHGTPNQDNAPNLTARYTEEYAYDPAGNMLSLKHSTPSTANSWTRHFGMSRMTPDQWNTEWPKHLTGTWQNPPSNRLTHVGDNDPTTPQTHFFDDNGNLVHETSSRHFTWDYSDRMITFSCQPCTTAIPSLKAYYLYDSAGQRVKKLVQKQGGEFEVTVYIDGVFEHHRLVNADGTQAVENNTIHVMDNQSRIALVRVGEAFPDDKAPEHPVKYHLGDHLGSSSLVISDDGAFINREEYFPYGETSFGSFARKRYRFTGKERDEESGLYYHGARYYAPWLCKWSSTDPAGMKDGMNMYCYVSNNPMNMTDPTGREEEGEGEEGGVLNFEQQTIVGDPAYLGNSKIGLVHKCAVPAVEEVAKNAAEQAKKVCAEKNQTTDMAQRKGVESNILATDLYPRLYTLCADQAVSKTHLDFIVEITHENYSKWLCPGERMGIVEIGGSNFGITGKIEKNAVMLQLTPYQQKQIGDLVNRIEIMDMCSGLKNPNYCYLINLGTAVHEAQHEHDDQYFFKTNDIKHFKTNSPYPLDESEQKLLIKEDTALSEARAYSTEGLFLREAMRLPLSNPENGVCLSAEEVRAAYRALAVQYIRPMQERTDIRACMHVQYCW